MKKYTQYKFDKMPFDDFGRKLLPSGDYRDVKINSTSVVSDDNSIFGKYSRFGDYSVFGRYSVFGINSVFGCNSEFGLECEFENKGQYIGEYPFYAFEGLGSRLGSRTYVFNLKSGIYVRCGCFFDNVDEFKKRVIEEEADSFYIEQIDLIIRKFKTN